MDEQTEKIIHGLVPLAIALGTFLIISLAFDILTELLITPSKFDKPVFVLVSFGFILLFYFYCLQYGKSKLGYFSNPGKLKKHLLFMVILPALVATYSGVQSYRSKKMTLQQPPSAK